MAYDNNTKTFTVSTADELNAAIANIDAIGKGGNNNGLAVGAYTIRLANDITLNGTQQTTYAAQNANGSTGAALTIDSGAATTPTAVAGSAQLYALNLSNGTTVTIDGAGHMLDGDKAENGFFVYYGTVGIKDLTIANAAARGGAGGGGGGGAGGGGAGLGGGLFVAGTGNTTGSGTALVTGGTVTLTDVSFSGSSATGGAGGLVSGGAGIGGGGGLEGGAGSSSGGGGGVGVTANASASGGAGGAGIVLGAAPGGSQDGGSTYGRPGTSTGGTGGGAGGNNSGGGIGGSGGLAPRPGGFGGGGGQYGGGGFGGGGGYGKSGGFGGGGGGYNSVFNQRGIGGFGAGSGGGGGQYSGGGGLGAGADVFVQRGGVLTIVGSGILGAGTATGGAAGGNGAGAGRGLGTALFLQGNQGLTLAPAAGSTIAVAGDIADQTGNGGTGANAGAGNLTVGTANAPGGVVVLGATNSYTGGTAVNAGTLLVDGSTSAASAVTVADGATLSGSGTMGGAVDLSGTLSASAAGFGTAGAPAAAGGPPTPGTGPSYGTLKTGALTFRNGSSLAEEIGGSTAGSYDTVSVTGTAKLGGTLNLSVATPSASTNGTSFTVLNASTAVTGTFSNAGQDAVLTSGGRSFQVNYTASAVTLTDVTPLPSYTIAESPASGPEGTAANSGTPFTYTVTRSGDTSQAGGVTLTLSGSATPPGNAGADYSVASGTGAYAMTGPATAMLGFMAGQATATFVATSTPDSLYEPDETVTATLTGVASGGGTIGTTNAATVTIANDDTAPSFAIGPANVAQNEGNNGTTPFNYTVTRTGDAQAAETVNYAVTGSGANPATASDFTGGALPSGTVTFTQGQATQTITIPVMSDTTVEPDEGFTLTLSAPNFGTITAASATGTIINDDATPSASGSPGQSLTPTPGQDYLNGTAGNDTIAALAGDDTINGLGGNDLIAGNQGNDLITVGDGANTVFGGMDQDTISAGNGPNVLLGNEGNDVITAGSGMNTVFGGMGNDVITVGDGGNLLFGGEGADTVMAGNGANTIVGGTGNSASDSLDGADYIASGSGDDLILGNGGDDTIGAGAGNDTAVGGYGNDVILGQQGNDIILGNQGDDTLFGGMGNDTLVGGQGNDVLIGGEGDDVLYGNEGLNTFVFNPGDTDFKSGTSTGDVIMDFATGTSRIDFASGPAGTADDYRSASTTATDFASIQALAQTLLSGAVSYAFVADGADGFLFTNGGNGTTNVTDAVKLAGAGTAGALKYQDIAHGALA